MKVALCLYGQPRYLDNPVPYKTHIDNIYSQVDVDVFTHFWLDEGDRYDSSDWSNKYENYILPDTLSLINEKYKPVRIVYENTKIFEMIDNDRMKGLTLYTDNNYQNLNCHLYSLERVLEMLEKHIEETGTSYDFVIVSRYDNIIHSFPDLKSLSSDKFYKSSQYQHFVDLMFVFNPVFINGLKAHQNFGELSNSVQSFIAEDYKLNNFLKYHSHDNIISTNITPGIARSKTDDHGQL